jgi:hypothetical protein
LEAESVPSADWLENQPIIDAKNELARRLDRVEQNTTHPGQRAILIGDAVDAFADSVARAVAGAGAVPPAPEKSNG